jgi:hypothetical protein
MSVQPLTLVPRRARLAQRVGDGLLRHRRGIVALQWLVIVGYAVLVIVPVLRPPPAADASLLTDLALFAQFVFWGLWWPFVIASVMLLGRAWCGLLCPEGALTEFASRHGLGRSIPRWLRWGGWPPLAFVVTTIWGQLLSVYDYPRATLLILGGSTLAALAVGSVYGRGKRVWFRYLCPVSGVFALLAKLSPLHFRVDTDAWKQYSGPRQRVDCAPLLDLRHLDSASQCHACGRCSGHRGAIALRPRMPGVEIVTPAVDDSRGPWPALLLVVGVLGAALGAFQWSASAWLVAARQSAAGWLVDHDAFALLQDNAPWWLLMHEPQAHDVFNWLDGAAILGFIGVTTLIIGGGSWLALWSAARSLRHATIGWTALAMSLVPIGGISLFVGLSQLTLTQLRAEGVLVPAVGAVRLLLLGGATCWSAALGARLVASTRAPASRRLLACVLLLVPLLLVDASWWMHLRGG